MTSRSQRGSWSGVPPWLAGSFGIAIGALGVVLMLRPLSSLSVLIVLVAAGLAVTGVATIVDAGPGGSPWLRLAGTVWVVAAAVVVAWPDLSTRALAVVVGVALVVGGVLDLVRVVRARTDERLAAALHGGASVIFGVLALAWPDVTLLVVAVLFGFRLVLVGLRLAWAAFVRSSDAHPGPEGTVGPVPAPAVSRVKRAEHVAVAAAMLALAIGLAALGAQLHASDGGLEDFYDTPDEVPAEPGVLLRSEPFDRGIPDGARAWRILYTTTRADGVPAVASGIVVAPDAARNEPLPVVAWAHGTTGVARRCAPSALPDPWGAGALFSLGAVVDGGSALVAPDYLGLGAEGEHPYLVGGSAGRSVLDAVRAARQLDRVALADSAVVWGHSQGGGAALWTGILAPTYAPEVDLVGVAALAPASDLRGLVDNLGSVTGGSIFASYALRGYAAEYEDVRIDDYVRPVARTTFRSAARRCLNGAVLASALSSITVGMDIFRGDLTSGPLLDRLTENVPSDRIDAPVLIAQGEDDGLVLPAVQAAYVTARCDAGFPVDYRTYPGRGHVELMHADSPAVSDLLRWTQARLSGEPETTNC